MSCKPFFPGWLVRNKRLLKMARKKKFRSQRGVDAWVNSLPESRGRKVNFYDPPVKMGLYRADRTRDRRVTPKARYLNRE